MAKAVRKNGKLPNAKKIAETVEALCAPVVASMGFELCEAEYALEDGNNVLTFYIYRESGVSIDDCEAVSNAIDPLLDEANPIEEPYYLSVSSLGLDRPLRRVRDYERRLGSDITVTLYAPLNGKKSVSGRLSRVDENGFVLVTDGKEQEFEFKSVASARPDIKF